MEGSGIRSKLTTLATLVVILGAAVLAAFHFAGLWIAVGAWVVLSAVVIILVRGLIKNAAEPIDRMNKTVVALTDGKMDVTLRADAPREAGDVGVLENGLAKLAISHHNFMGDLDALSRRAQKGEANLKIDAKNYPGGLRDIATQINAIAMALEKTNDDLISTMDAFARGSIAQNAKISHPKAAEATEKLGRQLQTIKDDVQKLSSAAKEGQFATRTSGTYAGEWAKFAGDANTLLEAINRPVGDIVSALERIESGTFSSGLSGAFSGEFEKVKKSIEAINTQYAGHLGEIASVLNDISYGRTQAAPRREYRGAFQAVQSAVNSVARSQDRLADDVKRAQQLATTRPTTVPATPSPALNRPAVTPAPTINRPAITPAKTIVRPAPAPASTTRPMTTVTRPFSTASTANVPRPTTPTGGGVNAPPPLPVNSGKVTVPSGAHEYNRKDYGKYK
ncbi:MAG: hypothetical protein FWC16_06570 [Defluviitaleaceae bacterium]|nr:hypothetical protein [Defluviitaleaceae bacterium]MCL2274574.1 hypothetical protein [Defluviitaleaceae bacterium]